MSDGYALLRAIEAAPDEDTPRLAYADWLDEHAVSDADRSWAEFIRVQCELGREIGGARRLALLRREDELRSAWWWVWAAQLFEPQFRRGFPEPVSLRDSHVADDPTPLAAALPLHHLRLVNAPASLGKVTTVPIMRHVRTLELTGDVRNHDLGVLARSPHLRNLRVLVAGHNRIGAGGCERLAAATVPALRHLALWGNPLRDAGLMALLRAGWLRNLAGLYANTCEISDAAVVRLADRAAVSGLRNLGLAALERGDAAAYAILGSPHLAQLERLWFPVRGLSPKARAALEGRFAERLNPEAWQYG